MAIDWKPGERAEIERGVARYPATSGHCAAAHVEGQMYKPLGSRPFVLVDRLEVSEGPGEAE